MSKESVEKLTSPEMIEGLGDLPLEEIRQRRAACQDAEEALSLRRRLVQGRLDIVQAELYRRSGNGSDADVSSLVGKLPEILVEHGDRHLGPGRLTALDPEGPNLGDDFDAFEKGLDDILGPETLGELSSTDEANLRQIADRLDELERSISSDRHKLHNNIDRFQEEIVRRYKTGQASVDNLLGN